MFQTEPHFDIMMKFSMRGILVLTTVVAVMLFLLVPVKLRITIHQIQRNQISDGSLENGEEVLVVHDPTDSELAMAKFIKYESKSGVATIEISRISSLKLRRSECYSLWLRHSDGTRTHCELPLESGNKNEEPLSD